MFANDIKIKISTGNSRKSKTWMLQEMYWSEFVKKLAVPVRTGETFMEYISYGKARQDEIKTSGDLSAENCPENSEE